MIKRSFTILTVIFLLMSQTAVHADVVMGNEFFYQNENKTEKLGKSFYVNGPSGYVIPKEEPGSEKGVSTSSSYVNFSEDVFTFINGEIVYITHTYLHDGEYWGVMSYNHAYQPPGWFPMDELLMLYDREDFEEENKDAFYTYTGSCDAVFAAERLVLWQWPGSDKEKRVLDGEIFNPISVNVLYAYKDEEGREWGYVRIDYTESWICLTDPANSNIPAFNPAPKPIKWSPEGIYEWTHTDTADYSVESYSLSNIIKARTYEENKTFLDVWKNAWYKDAVVAAYEYGIIDGKGNNKFDPNGNLGVGEALAIATRIHAYYKYGKKEGIKLISEYNSDRSHFTWWSGAAQYCKAEGLISDDEFDDNLNYYSSSPITRAQMVHIWTKILKSKDMTKQNTVIKLPDVNKDTDYSADIFLFYEAGIVGGVDAKGSFHPDGNITRAQAATIFMNLINVNKRYSGKTYGIAH